MKLLLLQLLCLSVFVSCTKEKEKLTDVEIFIQQVIGNKYTADTLPWFTPEDIPAILKSANNFAEITHFPVNPASSFEPTKLTIGECLLWTIENIRINYGNYPGKPPFPSLVPELKLKNDINSVCLNDSQLREVYNLYYNWWYDNISKNFEITRQIDPLKDSPYTWK
jgi:hypothetical protein